MRRLIAILTFLFLIGASFGCRIDPESFKESIQRLDIHTEYGDGSCTAFSIHSTMGYWVTAAHCVDHQYPLSINGQTVKRIRIDAKQDLAIIQGPLAPPLRIGRKPTVPDHLMVIGYLGGSDLLIAVELELQEHDRPWPHEPMLWVKNMIARSPWAALPGTSGGPVLDKHGTVISVMQGYESQTGQMLATWTDLRIITTNYREYQ